MKQTSELKEKILKEFKEEFSDIREVLERRYEAMQFFKMVDWLEQQLSQYEITTIVKRDKEIKFKIGMLRQWLNERGSKKLVTNKEIEHWLFEQESSQPNTKEDR